MGRLTGTGGSGGDNDSGRATQLSLCSGGSGCELGQRFDAQDSDEGSVDVRAVCAAKPFVGLLP